MYVGQRLSLNAYRHCIVFASSHNSDKQAKTVPRGRLPDPEKLRRLSGPFCNVANLL